MAVAITVVVADDDHDVRSALCAVLDADDRFAVVAQAATGPEAAAAVRRHQPAVVLLDVHMPGGGAEAAHEIHTIGFPVVMIVVSAQVDAALIADMLRVGVRGVLPKGRLGRSLPDLVARCAAGEVVLATPAAGEGLRLFARLDG